MAVTKKDVEPYVAFVEMGYNSLWFLTKAMQQENWNKAINEVDALTITFSLNAQLGAYRPARKLRSWRLSVKMG